MIAYAASQINARPREAARAYRTIAALVQAHREEILATLLHRTLEGRRPTLALDLLASGFIDHLVQDLDALNVKAFLSWVETSCKRYVGAPHSMAMLGAACGAVVDVLCVREAEYDAIAEDVRSLAEAVGRVIGRPRSVSTSACSETLDILDATIDRVMTALEAQDPASAEHSRAVSAWCARMARRLGLPRADAAFIARSGLLHDIGKTFTPLEILRAPRRLTEHEWAIMREHVTIGERLVLNVDELRPFAPVVRGHHERFDGGGYPDRLAGKEIPLAARIVSVADSFNAMIAPRPYRAQLSPTLALEELDRHRDTQFDGEIVDVMIDIVCSRISQPLT